jgi:hypothetical protein
MRRLREKVLVVFLHPGGGVTNLFACHQRYMTIYASCYIVPNNVELASLLYGLDQLVLLSDAKKKSTVLSDASYGGIEVWSTEFGFLWRLLSNDLTACGFDISVVSTLD